MTEWVRLCCIECGAVESFRNWAEAQAKGWRWVSAWQYCPDCGPPVPDEDEEDAG